MLEKIVVHKPNNIYFKIDCDPSQSMELKNYFSYYIPNYWFSPRFKNKVWDGKVSSYNRQSQTLPIGLYPMLKHFCVHYGYELVLDFDKTNMFNQIEDEDIQKFYETIFTDTKYYPRDYQAETILKALKYKRGVIESPTGSGKSIVIYSIIRFILGITEGKILLIVPNVSLVNQMFNDFKDYGWTACESYTNILYSGKKPDWSKPILISTWQSVYKKTSSFFESFNAVIVDETHGAKANSIKSVLEKCTGADYRIGLTGTLPTEKSDIYTIYGYIGPKIYEISSKELMDKGILSKIKIANLLLQYSEDEIATNKHRTYDEEVRFLVDHPKRNGVFKYIIDHINPEENVLILCYLIDHLKSIKSYLEKIYPNKKIQEIYGEIDADKREQIRIGMENSKGVILLGTYATMGIGINIKRLHHVIFASSYKSKIKILQSIGRGLRTHESKTKLILWDIVDDLTYVKRTGTIGKNYVYEHFEQRLEYYKTQEFSYINKNIIVKNL